MHPQGKQHLGPEYIFEISDERGGPLLKLQETLSKHDGGSSGSVRNPRRRIFTNKASRILVTLSNMTHQCLISRTDCSPNPWAGEDHSFLLPLWFWLVVAFFFDLPFGKSWGGGNWNLLSISCFPTAGCRKHLCLKNVLPCSNYWNIVASKNATTFQWTLVNFSMKQNVLHFETSSASFEIFFTLHQMAFFEMLSQSLLICKDALGFCVELFHNGSVRFMLIGFPISPGSIIAPSQLHDYQTF